MCNLNRILAVDHVEDSLYNAFLTWNLVEYITCIHVLIEVLPRYVNISWNNYSIKLTKKSQRKKCFAYFLT